MGVEGKLRYEARLKAQKKGGSFQQENEMVAIENADEVTLYFAAATNFVNYQDVSADEHERVNAYLNDIQNKSYENIRIAAVKDYKSLFDRVSLSLPITKSSYLPTDERLTAIASFPISRWPPYRISLADMCLFLLPAPAPKPPTFREYGIRI